QRALHECALAHADQWRDDLTALLNAKRERQLPGIPDALRTIHAPTQAALLDRLTARTHVACERLILEELLAHHMALRRSRSKAQGDHAFAFRSTSNERELERKLPFTLTTAQRRVIAEIGNDLAKSQPMQRLLQGDVGSGKTIVAAMAIARVAEHGHQAAIMAPTEILAEQHAESFAGWLQPLGVDVALLTGNLRGNARRMLLAALDSGELSVVVGTHALFQPDVVFHNLSLVIVDEQHRFGVHQRLDLRQKGVRDGSSPHQLVMTATPIPRTLTMSVYADLDVSVIDELPPGRSPVGTVVLGDDRRDEVISRIANACSEGRQVYWVCTLIEESELLQCEAAETTAKRLGTELPTLRVGLIHGRMKPHEKAMTMEAFKAGDIELLVATTVIEVGVDVPNATLMVIENAERLGLAQLHQLRGRVGRGEVQSHCVLMYHAPLSEHARARLAVMRQTNDGFAIAEKDLELRGPGELLGTRQTGLVEYRVADLMRDRRFFADVRRLAPTLDSADVVVDRLLATWCPE
ncbi:MAG: ATP-dependent DNA helicase RecG, partial [Gammaproteobacteria bacterium]